MSTNESFDPDHEAQTTSELEEAFAPFRSNIEGQWTKYNTPYGTKTLVYADWTASGRRYTPVDRRLEKLAEYYGNSHSHHSFVGCHTTKLYEDAKRFIGNHVGADPTDVVLACGSGMTGAVNRLQRMMGLRSDATLTEQERPVIPITHMEHHSNHTSWIETVGEVIVIEPDENGLPDLNHLEEICKNAVKSSRPIIASVTASSNVTGIDTPIYDMAKVVHKYGGMFSVDYAASAPYVDINMHPDDPDAVLDAIFFSPHKFLGGPEGAGILIFNQQFYRGGTPVNVGGGIVDWTNPWGEHSYVKDIECREDAGTPPLFQTMRAALAISVKEEMGVERIQNRKKELLTKALSGLEAIDKVDILAPLHKDRQGIISFTIDDLHYGLAVALLSDRFGVQARDGCSCAGTYGHYLFGIDRPHSEAITCAIDYGDQSAKPGWVRIGLHPTMTNKELDWILYAIEEVAKHGNTWKDDYQYCSKSNSWHNLKAHSTQQCGNFFETLTL